MPIYATNDISKIDPQMQRAIDPNPFMDPVRVAGADPSYDNTENKTILNAAENLPDYDPTSNVEGLYFNNQYAFSVGAGYSLSQTTFYRRNLNVIEGYMSGVPILPRT